ncbi:hypothetical protein RBWH47_00851 [Rhodopirellula baltica WH47]|uniref:Uncharacterized protein n=1 Tax=Rhodopirellula baltica WH47 TaxID=991778 RepID=F2AY64_RHOBT|nr:hypothetical protein RBWH47_00851 [Rhodopirellula baltica WH47]
MTCKPRSSLTTLSLQPGAVAPESAPVAKSRIQQSIQSAQSPPLRSQIGATEQMGVSKELLRWKSASR